MKLYELFNNVGPWKWARKTDVVMTANFNINSIDYEFKARADGQYGCWSVEFGNQAVPVHQRFSVTGSGSASSVFATVCAILKDMIRIREVYEMTFVAEEPNRLKLYKRIAATVFPNWQMEESGSFLHVTHKDYVSEGYWKNKQIDQEFDKATSRQPVDFTVMINGKTWKRNGEPILFKDHASALHAANKITTDRNITTQVIPAKRS